MTTIWEHRFGHNWRKALVSLPRLVPDYVLRFTSPEGPQPVVISLPSRGRHLIPVYLFIPPAVLESNAKLPVLIDFHGGGFITGSCQEQTPFCAKFARKLACLVISVDYRLGPYAKFPAAIEDAEDIIHAILDASSPASAELQSALDGQITALRKGSGITHLPSNVSIDTTRIAVSGFSSGGNLALNLALSIEASATQPSAWPAPIPANFPRKIPILLFYPSLDCRQLPAERSRPPALDKKPGIFASLRLETELMPTYLPRDRAGEPRASPGLAPVSGLHSEARMLLVLPELDTLAEQSEIWVSKVNEQGRGEHLEVQRYKGMVHGWTQFPDAFKDQDARRTTREIFDKAVRFVGLWWDPKTEK